MAEIVVTSTSVGVVFPLHAEVYDFIAAESITAGQAVYLASSGKVGIADANAAGKEQFRGLALNSVGAGQAISVLKRGHVYGFTLTSLAYDALAYLSDDAGKLDSAAGTLSVTTGRVIALSDAGNLTKVLFIDANWRTNWA